jgi:hypothetical protein
MMPIKQKRNVIVGVLFLKASNYVVNAGKETARRQTGKTTKNTGQGVIQFFKLIGL